MRVVERRSGTGWSVVRADGAVVITLATLVEAEAYAACLSKVERQLRLARS